MTTQDASTESDEGEGLWEEDYDASLDDDDIDESRKDRTKTNRRPTKVVNNQTPFVTTPVWVLLQASDRAYKVYGLLARKSNNTEKDLWALHSTLAREAGVSKETIRRGIKELKDLGAIKVVPQFSNGFQSANYYIVNTGEPFENI